jgi:hypothetical protein
VHADCRTALSSSTLSQLGLRRGNRSRILVCLLFFAYRTPPFILSRYAYGNCSSQTDWLKDLLVKRARCPRETSLCEQRRRLTLRYRCRCLQYPSQNPGRHFFDERERGVLVRSSVRLVSRLRWKLPRRWYEQPLALLEVAPVLFSKKVWMRPFGVLCAQRTESALFWLTPARSSSSAG